MQNARTVVNEEVARGSFVGVTIPEDLKPAFDRHSENVVQLVVSLEAAGTDSQKIRSLVSTLLRAYEKELLTIIEARL